MQKDDKFYWNGKSFVPSGTTVLPSPDLRNWVAGTTAKYIFETVAPTQRKAVTAYQRESTEAADYGTYIHTLCQICITNDIQIESPHEMTQSFMDGLWSWKTKRHVKVIAMEHEVVTDTYGGRLDLVCEMDVVGRTKNAVDILKNRYQDITPRAVTLVDFKTSTQSSYYPEYKYQLAGYRQGWNENSAGLILPPIERQGILKFNKTTMKVNYKDFTEYQATRPCESEPRLPSGKLPTEKYIRTYEMDRKVFNDCVALWWSINRGISI